MKNPKFALLIAELPQTGNTDADGDAWSTFQKTVQAHHKKTKGSEQIHDNVWLVPLHDGFSGLPLLVTWAKSSGVKSRILFLEEAPDWIVVPPFISGTC